VGLHPGAQDAAVDRQGSEGQALAGTQGARDRTLGVVAYGARGDEREIVAECQCVSYGARAGRDPSAIDQG
jgi:hypothetical protein